MRCWPCPVSRPAASPRPRHRPTLEVACRAAEHEADACRVAGARGATVADWGLADADRAAADELRVGLRRPEAGDLGIRPPPAVTDRAERPEDEDAAPGAAPAAEPDMIICDEVTSALDQIVQEGILKLLLRLQNELGLTYLFITHDISTVKAIADQVVVMNEGRVVEQGSKTEVFQPPHPAYTELLLSSVPEMDPDWLTNLNAARNR